MVVPMTAAEKVREARRRLGLTQHDLSHHLGVSANTIARWEQGAVPVKNIAILAIENLLMQPIIAAQDVQAVAWARRSYEMAGLPVPEELSSWS